MRKAIVRLMAAAAVVVLSVAMPVTVSALDVLDGACQNGSGAGSAVCNNGAGNDPIAGQGGVIINVTTLLATIAGIVSIIFIVWGGFKYITSNGESSAISSAKNTILAALIGLVIAALARPIVNYVIGRL